MLIKRQSGASHTRIRMWRNLNLGSKAQVHGFKVRYVSVPVRPRLGRVAAAPGARRTTAPCRWRHGARVGARSIVRRNRPRPRPAPSAQTLPPKPAPKLLDANAPMFARQLRHQDRFRDLVAEQLVGLALRFGRQLAERGAIGCSKRDRAPSARAPFRGRSAAGAARRSATENRPSAEGSSRAVKLLDRHPGPAPARRPAIAPVPRRAGSRSRAARARRRRRGCSDP